MTFDPRSNRVLSPCLRLALLVSSLMTATAVAQPAPTTKDAVIKPPPQVDTHMQVKPKSAPALPTPVLKPPPTVIPK